jgi:hypothetical protein
MSEKEARQIVAAILTTAEGEPRDVIERYRDILQMLRVNVVTVKAGTDEEGIGTEEPITVVICEFDD